MALSILIRAATDADAEALAEIEQEAFPDPSWTAADFFRYECMVAEVDGVVAGFLVSRENFAGDTDTPPEREILNVAVRLAFRRQGIGARLLAEELRRTADVFLEVRMSNVAAIQLYKNAGFIEISQRRNYYANPVESAIVMRMKW